MLEKKNRYKEYISKIKLTFPNLNFTIDVLDSKNDNKFNLNENLKKINTHNSIYINYV